MQVTPVEGSSTARHYSLYPVPPHPRYDVSRVRAAETEPSREGNSDRPAAERIAFQQAMWAPGINVLRLVDTATGDVVVQLPPEQVLHLVDDVIRRIRERETTHGDR